MRTISLIRHHMLGGTALAVMVSAGAANAQTVTGATAEPAPTAAASAPATTPVQTADVQRAGGLEEIVVTARRRAESVQDIPVAVAAISAVQIQNRDLTNIEKIAAATPQFTVARASNGAGAQLTLRGIGSSATSIGIEQSVAIIVDSVYYGAGRVINEGFFDLARVEILKGPQALFFGKNATAGVISLTSADPGPDRELIARGSYEFNGEQIVGELIGSTPITETLGIRLALRGAKMYDGFYKNKADPGTYTTIDAATGVATNHLAPASARNQPGERELIGRLTLKWEPTDQLTVTLKGSGDYNKTDGNGWNYVPVNCNNGVTQLNPNYRCGEKFTIYQNDIPADIAADLPFARGGGLYNIYKSYQGTGTINYAMDDVTFTSISNYNWNRNSFACDCDFLGGNTWATERAEFRAISEEIRVQTTLDGPLNLMVGGYFQDTQRDFYQAVLFAGADNSAAAPANRYIAYSKLSRTDGRTLSAYGQVTWKVLPRVELAGGVRYIHETKDSVFTQPYVNPTLTGIFRPESAAANGTLFGDQTFSNWAPEVTISYKPVDDIMLYGAYKTAYKSGGFSNSAINSALSADPAADLTFQPEKGAGFEGGIKSTIFDRQLRANLGLYSYKYTDLQVDFFNAQIFAYQTYNAGTARSKGVEFELEYAPRQIAGLTLHGSINYNSARYKEFLAPCYSGQTPAQGCTLVSRGAPFQDLAGAPTAMAPKWTGTAGFAYESALGTTMKIGFNADARYSASYIASSYGNERTRQSKYAILDAGIRVGAENDSWELALIGKNLTNRFYFTGGSDAPLTGSGTGTPGGIGGDQIGYGSMPRTVRLQATVRY